MYRGPLTQSPPCFYGSPEGPVTLLAAHLRGRGEGCSVGCSLQRHHQMPQNPTKWTCRPMFSVQTTGTI